MSASQQSGVAVFRMFFNGVHQYLEGTMQGADSSVLNWSPQPGPASILGQYAHVVTGEDWLVNVKAKGAAPLMASTKAGHTGFRTPPPITGWDEWARKEAVDFATLRSYAQAVFQATDDYLASITDRDLERMVDLSEIGMGMVPVAQVLILAASNCCTHTGEISALKGLCGLAGYPMAETEAMPVPA
ncbi:MAG: DinB family protein [Caldilineaceae bacterium]|nr:DinB family protein [Caldilineaceae bacterium]MBP8110511.1 DinB family protein [Caldilineaceae bacterium]MBP8122709.1 DinB family protein [Caldilineaceae bacterium]MBP9072179.1 DinB family protein [Caldilineaceae bacterium]